MSNAFISTNPFITKYNNDWLGESIEHIKSSLITDTNTDSALNKAVDIRNNLIDLKNSYAVCRNNSVWNDLEYATKGIGELESTINTQNFPRNKDGTIGLSEVFFHLDNDISYPNSATGPSFQKPTMSGTLDYSQDRVDYMAHLHPMHREKIYDINIAPGNSGDTIYHKQHLNQNQQQKPQVCMMNSSGKLPLNGRQEKPTPRRKRPNHPKQVTTMLYSWYNLHKNNPYPDESAKKALQQQTGLNAVQLNNWFINGD